MILLLFAFQVEVWLVARQMQLSGLVELQKAYNILILRNNNNHATTTAANNNNNHHNDTNTTNTTTTTTAITTNNAHNNNTATNTSRNEHSKDTIALLASREAVEALGSRCAGEIMLYENNIVYTVYLAIRISRDIRVYHNPPLAGEELVLLLEDFRNYYY